VYAPRPGLGKAFDSGLHAVIKAVVSN